MPEPTATAAVPATQHAIQIVAAGETVHNRAKPVPAPGPTQILLRIEAVGICFSDTKLLHAFTNHPRKGEVIGGLSPEALAENPSYVPGEAPTVPGHEVVARIVAVGGAVAHHRTGERVLVQTDYRHLPTARSNAAFGYNFEGGLQEYVVVDERMVIEPGTGERFLIPVDEEPSASAVALLEPWACVEASYTVRERGTLLPSGRLLVVADRGATVRGLDTLLSAVDPGFRDRRGSRRRPGGGRRDRRSRRPGWQWSAPVRPTSWRRHRSTTSSTSGPTRTGSRCWGRCWRREA